MRIVFSKMRYRSPKYLCLLFMLLLGGCSATALLSSLSGAGRYIAAEDIPYGEKPNQLMDVYQPNGRHKSESKNHCTLMFVYGGSWQSGDKKNYGFVAAGLAREGYSVVVPNYRKYPNAVFPEFIHDLGQALSHPLLKKKDSSQRLAVIGHSAGALNAALLAYDPKYLRAIGLAPSAIDIFISLSGPHDYFLPSQKEKWQAIFGKNSNEQTQALSVNYVSATAPTTLILHGEKDTVVTPRSAYSLADKLSKYGVPHSVKIYPGIGHQRIVAAMSPLLAFLAPTLKDIVEFLKENQCEPTGQPG